jgi:uncharacterized repeat protein (TIGR01451 family)
MTRTLHAACLAVGAALLLPTTVHAQFATGGSGLHRDRIFWVDWGTNGEDVFAGKTLTRGFNIGSPASADNRLDITCQLSNAAVTRGIGGLFVYAPGDWRGDGLDELYHIGGNDPGDGAGIGGNPNMLAIGLRTSPASTVEFDFDCSATLGGAPFPLNGLVFADAEASGLGEFVSARLSNGGTLRVIDQISQCGATTGVTVLAGPPQEARLGNAASHCQDAANPALQRGGPALVGFIDGATSARVIVHGGGVSAVAVGAVIELEFSEAIPASYGTATHVLNANWAGGFATTGVDYTDPANLATLTYGLRLGATLVPDRNADGPVGSADVDALAKTTGPLGGGYADVPPPMGPAGAAYSIANVACSGPASVAGWIDFNGNGLFDSGERSAIAACAAGSGSVDLSWTIPAPGTVPQATSHLRLRIAPDATELASASDIAVGGEVEDYRLTIPGPTLTLRKAWVGARIGDATTLQTTGLTNDVSFAATADATDEIDVAAAVAVHPGETAALAETLAGGNVGLYVQSLACTGAADTDPGDGLTVAVGDVAIVCTFTNEIQRADLVLTKTNTPGENAEQDQVDDNVVSGATTAYAITVTNNGPHAAHGAVLRDPAGTGLSCTTASCTANGGAGCPADSGPALLAALQGPGAAVPTLPAGGSVVVVVQCIVQ